MPEFMRAAHFLRFMAVIAVDENEEVPEYLPAESFLGLHIHIYNPDS